MAPRDPTVPRKLTLAARSPGRIQDRARSRARELARLPVVDDEEARRPRTRRDCKDGPRPCPYVACRHHLYIDVQPKRGSLTLNWPDRGVDEIPQTCALDVADQGGLTLERVADLLNLTRERIRQIEASALRKVEAALGPELCAELALLLQRDEAHEDPRRRWRATMP
ncbi:MAG: DNA-binding protein [Gammaproteobacteria bacterium]|nr:DNA-binding protein [Gammaproteobacteria bacterium]NIR85210.1 DNA-binding protein [Gammaproteobacteria bacterium]NIU06260.1 DNA-binding protein [Gammaproteobacteria bacterium]NIX87533.1 DNA-binding protein [Gammaproteobacteria bacterium]